MTRSLLGVLLGGLLLVSPASAQVRDGLGITLSATGGAFALGDRALQEGLLMRTPDPLRGVPIKLDGTRGFVGGVLRETMLLGAIRWSFGAGLAALPGDGARVLAPDGLPGGLTARGRTPLAASFDLAVGRQIKAGPLLPYLDIRTSFHILSSRVDLRSPQLGLLSVTSFEDYAFGLGPRLGFWMPLGMLSHLDVSARADVLGPERFGVDVGVGFFLPWDSRRRRSY